MTRRNIDTIWGSTGAISDPGTTKMNLGWIAEIPTHQHQNFWQERADAMLQWIEQYGIQDWDAATSYADLGLCMGTNGVIYQSQQAANLNHAPIGDGGTWWEQANFTASLVAAGGYIQLHGDTSLIIQWGKDNVAGNTVDDLITLPIAYPTAHAVAVGHEHLVDAAGIQDAGAWPESLTQVALSNADSAARDVNWISIGW